MTRQKIYLLSTFLMALMALVACKNDSDQLTYEYIPFQESDDGMWGMIAPNGEVLFSEEFKGAPTVVTDGRFFVKNKDGYYELYTAEKKPKKIGAEYAHAHIFHNGCAFVAEKGKPISIIDTEGKVVKELAKIDGKEVDGVSPIFGVGAIYKADSLYGVIDNQGNQLIKADYTYIKYCGDGHFIAVNKKYTADKDTDKKYEFLDRGGKKLFELRGDKFERIGEFSNGNIAYSIKKDGEAIWGIMNDKGETVLKPKEKVKNIFDLNGNLFTYWDGDAWGLMNIDGETLIRAKYDLLFFDEGNRMWAFKVDGTKRKWKIIDTEGNDIGKDDYVGIGLSYKLSGGSYAIVKSSDSEYSIIDNDGNDIKGIKVDLRNINVELGDEYIESDYVDFDVVFKNLGLSQDGVAGLSFSTTPQQSASIAKKGGSYKDATPDDYKYSNSIEFTKDVNGISVLVKMGFESYMAEEVTHTVKEPYYTDYWGNTYYYDRTVHDGYRWSNTKPDLMFLGFNNKGKLRGKLKSLLNKTITVFSSWCKIEQQNNGAAVIALNNGKRAFICLGDNVIIAGWGDLAKDDIDITKYEDAHEEGISNNDYTTGAIDWDVDSVMPAAVDEVVDTTDTSY